MTAEDNLLAAIAPCARGCTWAPASEDEASRPKPAKHGLLCHSCFYRLTGALRLVPDLMANMRAQITGIRAAEYSVRVSGGGDGSPAPLNLGPLDASDSLFAKLVGWTVVFAEEFHVTPPAIPSWANDREVQGSKPVTPEAAHMLAAWLCDWLTDRLEEIAGNVFVIPFHADLIDGHEDARGVFSLSAAYGVEPRPLKHPEDRECPLCGELTVFIKWPDKFSSDMAVLCDRCTWVADPKTYRRWLELATA